MALVIQPFGKLSTLISAQLLSVRRTRNVEVFLRGGLGNQLIQAAYVSAVAMESPASWTLNYSLLSPLSSWLLRVTNRAPSLLLTGYSDSLSNSSYGAMSLLRICTRALLGRLASDSSSHSQILRMLSRPSSNISLIGYYHRYEAFAEKPGTFWKSFATYLLQTFPEISPYPYGQVVVHIRMGDYLERRNTLIYAHHSIESLLSLANSWRLQLGSSLPIHIVTDDSKLFLQKLPAHLAPQVQIIGGLSADEDFLLLARHKHIVTSNSTFSLCAGRISSDLWNLQITTVRPVRWYQDEQMNRDINSMLAMCNFCVTSDALLDQRNSRT